MAAGPGRRGEVGVEVDEHGARKVPRLVVAAALAGLGQPPADVRDPQVRIVEPLQERFGRDEGHWPEDTRRRVVRSRLNVPRRSCVLSS